MNNLVLILLIVALGLLALFIIPQWRLKRAVRQVIRIFGEYNAIGIKNAKTIDKLGLRPQGMMDQMLKGRDYKQYALSTLIKSGIVQMTEDGRLYLVEDKLIESGLSRDTSYLR